MAKSSMAVQLEEQHNPGDTTIPIKIYFEIPNFYGNSSVRMWIKQCEKCFSLLETPNEQKVDLAYMCMFDKAYVWAQDYICNNLDVEWPEFVKDLCDQFGTIIRGDIMDIEEKEFKKWEDSLEEYLSDKIQDYEDFFNNSMEHKEKDEIDVMQHKEKEKSIKRLEEKVKKMMQAIEKKDEIDVLGEAEMDKEGVVDVVLDSADTSSEPASEDVSLGVNLFAHSEILGDAKQVFDGNLDKGSMKDNTQSTVMHKEGQLCQTYQVPQFSRLKKFVQYDGLGNAPKYGWQAKPLPWRDKSEVVFFKPRGTNKNSVLSVVTAENWNLAFGFKLFCSRFVHRVLYHKIQYCGVYYSDMHAIKLLGMHVLRAKGEDEARCGQLNKGGHVDDCITAVGDSFLFGAKCVIKSLRPNTKVPCECYYMSDIEVGFGLKRRHLIAICRGVAARLLVLISVRYWTGLRIITSFKTEFVIGTKQQFSYKELNDAKGCQAARTVVSEALDNIDMGKISKHFQDKSDLNGWVLDFENDQKISNSQLRCKEPGKCNVLFTAASSTKQVHDQSVSKPDVQQEDNQSTPEALDVACSPVGSELDASGNSTRNGDVYEISGHMRPLPWRDKFIQSSSLYVEFDIKYNKIFGDTNVNYVSVNWNSAPRQFSYKDLKVMDMDGSLGCLLNLQECSRCGCNFISVFAILETQMDTEFLSKNGLQRWLQLLSSVIAKDLRSSLFEGGMYDKGSQSPVKQKSKSVIILLFRIQ